jgi:antitoxin component of MazEF toxin-antitoxin module
MTLETRLWRTGYAENLMTTVPRAIRQQLNLTATDKITWRVEGSVAEVRKEDPDGNAGADVTAYTLYKQSRGNSLYTAIPMSVIEQLRLTNRSRAEWELHGDHARVRRA